MAITPLPGLDRSSTSFKADVDTFFASSLPVFSNEVNTVMAAVDADAVATAADRVQTGLDRSSTAESAAAALSSKNAAATSASGAATSASTATTQASTATTQASNASGSASGAGTSATNAATSASGASNSATTATTQASNASTSASSASTSASNAATSATGASGSASTATTQASNASTSASGASTSASTATTKASEASSSAAAALSSKNAAATSETNAADSAADAAASAYDVSNKANTASPTFTGTVTLPAVSLAGTVAGGGNQINNVVIGASTPLAGSFTTLSAGGPITVSGIAPFIDLKESGTSIGLLSSTDVFSGTSKDVVLYGRAGKKLHFWSEGSVSDATPGSAVLSSTGLAVTGAISATGSMSSGGLVTGTALTANGAASYKSIARSGTNDSQFQFYAFDGITSQGFFNAQPLGLDWYAPNTTKVLAATSTGLAVTGVISASGNARIGSNVDGGFSGVNLTLGSASGTNRGISFKRNDTNADTAFFYGDDSTAYLGANTGPLNLYASGALRGAFTSTGLAVTGAINATGAISGASSTFNGGIETLLRLQSSNSGTTGTDGALFSIDSANNAYLWNYEAAPTIFGTNNTERARIDSAGNLGIGGTANNYAGFKTLAVIGPDTTHSGIVRVRTSDDSIGMNIYADATGPLFNTTNNPLRFLITDVERMRLDSAGNLGIGTSSPSAAAGTALAINGAGNQARLAFKNTSTGDTASDGFQIGIDSAGEALVDQRENLPIRFSTNAIERMRLDSAGNLGLGVVPSTWEASGALQLGNNSGESFGYSKRGVTQNAYFDGSSFRYYGTAAASLYQPSNGSHAWYNAPSGTAGTTFSFTQAMTLDASGNLGIGTSSPSAALSIERASDSAEIKLKQTGAGGRDYRIASTGASYGSAGHLVVYDATAGAERARIDSSGNLLVGSTSALSTSKLWLQGDFVTNNGIGFRSTPATGTAYFNYFVYNASAVGSISSTGSSTSYTTTSDYRLKNTVAPMTGALDKVALLKPVTYKWNADGSDGQGFIAHELAEVEPGCVTGEKDATETRTVETSPAIPAVLDAEGVETSPAVAAVTEEQVFPKYQGIDTSFLVATLAAAIQEQQVLIKDLTARLAALEAA
jgi:hypothetical protein